MSAPIDTTCTEHEGSAKTVWRSITDGITSVGRAIGSALTSSVAKAIGITIGVVALVAVLTLVAEGSAIAMIAFDLVWLAVILIALVMSVYELMDPAESTASVRW